MNSFIILSQLKKDCKNDNHSHQLALSLELRQKPQISSIPGVSPKQRDRYRVVLRGAILGDRLSIDQAIAFGKRGEWIAFSTPNTTNASKKLTREAIYVYYTNN
jgi:hypothetical protein